MEVWVNKKKVQPRISFANCNKYTASSLESIHIEAEVSIMYPLGTVNK